MAPSHLAQAPAACCLLSPFGLLAQHFSVSTSRSPRHHTSWHVLGVPLFYVRRNSVSESLSSTCRTTRLRHPPLGLLRTWWPHPLHPQFLLLDSGGESSFSLLSSAREILIHSSGLLEHPPLTSGVEFRSCLVAQSCSTLCDPMDCSPPGSSVCGVLQAEITGVGCCFLLQGVLPTQGANPHPLPWQVSSSLLSLKIEIDAADPASPRCLPCPSLPPSPGAAAFSVEGLPRAGPVPDARMQTLNKGTALGAPG